MFCDPLQNAVETLFYSVLCRPVGGPPAENQMLILKVFCEGLVVWVVLVVVLVVLGVVFGDPGRCFLVQVAVAARNYLYQS